MARRADFVSFGLDGTPPRAPDRNGEYRGPARVRILPPGVSGEDLAASEKTDLEVGQIWRRDGQRLRVVVLTANYVHVLTIGARGPARRLRRNSFPGDGVLETRWPATAGAIAPEPEGATPATPAPTPAPARAPRRAARKPARKGSRPTGSGPAPTKAMPRLADAWRRRGSRFDVVVVQIRRGHVRVLDGDGRVRRVAMRKFLAEFSLTARGMGS